MADLAEALRRLETLERGIVRMAGEVSLSLGATSTTKKHKGVTPRSVVTTTAHASPAANSDITRIVPGTDEFVITHTSSASARVHRYTVSTPGSYT